MPLPTTGWGRMGWDEVIYVFANVTTSGEMITLYNDIYVIGKSQGIIHIN
jgi:hypothetical protein